MNRPISLLIAALILLPCFLRAQPDLPPPGEVFIDEVVPRIDIYIDPDTLEWILDNVESNIEFHADFQFDNGNIDETIEDIGFRLRGNTSRYSQKKSFKVSFNTYDAGAKWYGHEKLNINGEHNDPSVIRSKLCWDLLFNLDVPGPRSNHVEFYINDDFRGLYINVEHIDEEFVLSRFGNNDGNLYKCLYPADLAYLGSDPENYKLVANGHRVYDLKTNTEVDDYSDLALFIDVLNNTPDEDFLCEIEKVFNVYDYLKIIAFDVITADWDGYIFNKNNFYLYHNTETGKFEYINYDLDNTFGIDWFNILWAERDVYDWHQEFRPLYSRIMNTPELRSQYTHYLNYIAEELLEPEAYTNYVDNLKWQSAPYIEEDPYYPLDYGFTYEDYLNSFDEALGMHVKYGLYPYLETRRSTLFDQLDNTDPYPVLNYIRNNHPQEGEDFKVRAFIDCLDDGSTVSLQFTVNAGTVQTAEMFDDGAHWDKEAGDHIYGCLLPDMQLNTTIEYQVNALRSDGLSTLLPCEPNTYTLLPSDNDALFINEFMASNNNTIADEYGEFDDWIEVYNGGDVAVWLGDKYLTDNLGNEDKWLMPDYTLEPEEFVLFWADDDPEQGAFHTTFKLDADGEEIGIFDAENTGFMLLDSLSFGPQLSDVSKGRKEDGGTPWVYFTVTTPGYSNLLGAVNIGLQGIGELSAYPNPVWHGVVSFGREISFILYTAHGIPVLEAANVKSANLAHLSSGLYLLRTTEGESVKLLIH